MKKILMAIVLMPLMALAETWKDPNTGIVWTYSINEGYAEVGDGSPCAISKETIGSITIPSTFGGLVVTKVREYAFYGCKGLTSVSMPTSVTRIGSSAFNGCSSLASVTIPSSVVSIGSKAFANTKWLSDQDDGLVIVDGCLIEYKGTCSGTVAIPDGVRVIADSAFCECRGLMAVTISKDVVRIGAAAFSGCTGLTALTIPFGVTNIGEAAFYGCTNLSAVTIPASVVSIEYCAFSGSKLIVDHSDGLVIVDDCLIEYKGTCPEIMSIPAGVRVIADYAFFGCGGLTTLMIPDGVISIGAHAFHGCSELNSVATPASATTIGQYAFCNCISLTSGLLWSITSIGQCAFFNCPSLSAIYVNAMMKETLAANRDTYGLLDSVMIIDQPVLTKNEVEEAVYKVKEAVVFPAIKAASVTLEGKDGAIDENDYLFACKYYDITPKIKPETPATPSADEYVVVSKQSIRAAKAETVKIENGQVELAVSVLSNSNITAEIANWGKVNLASENVKVENGNVVITIPVDSASGFMILQSKDAKVNNVPDKIIEDR